MRLSRCGSSTAARVETELSGGETTWGRDSPSHWCALYKARAHEGCQCWERARPLPSCISLCVFCIAPPTPRKPSAPKDGTTTFLGLLNRSAEDLQLSEEALPEAQESLERLKKRPRRVYLAVKSFSNLSSHYYFSKRLPHLPGNTKVATPTDTPLPSPLVRAGSSLASTKTLHFICNSGHRSAFLQMGSKGLQRCLELLKT